MINDCLIYWVVKMHVDGFRFDLASIMGRDEDGSVMANPPLLLRLARIRFSRTRSSSPRPGMPQGPTR